MPQRYTPTFDEIQGARGVGINRRRVTAFNPPALSRHIVLWLPRLPSDPDNISTLHVPLPKPHSPSDERRARLDYLIAETYKAIRADPKRFQCFDTNSWDAKRESIVLFSVSMSAISPFCLTILTSPETQRALKFSFEFEGVKTVLAFELHEELATLTIILDASIKQKTKDYSSWLYDALGANLARLAQPIKRSIEQTRELRALFYEAVWDYLETAIPAMGALGLTGRVILDSRGIILEPQPRRSRFTQAPLIKLPFSRDTDSNVLGPARIDPLREPLAVGVISDLLPLLTHEFDEPNEYTLSTLMANRALFASCLGSGPDVFSSRQTHSVTFLLLVDAYNSWQLGRLLYRIHRAGSARVSATIYFSTLRDRSERLREVEQTLEEALSTPAPTNAQDNETTVNGLREGERAYRSTTSALNDILEYGAGEPLSYRIDRSRYYVRQFNRATAALRIGRIEGFQPYDEFVEQRQGSAFALIDLLGRRYGRIREDRSLLLRRIQVLLSQQREANILDSQRKITKIQRTADIALLLVLGPYYAGSVFTHLLTHWLPKVHQDNSRASFVLWAGTFLVFGIMFAIREIEERDLLTSRFYKVIAFCIGLLGLSALAFYAAGRDQQIEKVENQHVEPEPSPPMRNPTLPLHKGKHRSISSQPSDSKNQNATLNDAAPSR